MWEGVCTGEERIIQRGFVKDAEDDVWSKKNVILHSLGFPRHLKILCWTWWLMLIIPAT
jgi:hypothetical protein